METLVIKSSECLRGEDSWKVAHDEYGGETECLNSYLLREDGKMCCLGIYGKQCGIPESVLYNVATPSEAVREASDPAVIPDRYRYLFVQGDVDSFFGSTQFAHEAMQINDTRYITDDERIERLRNIFSEYGIAIDWRPNE